MSNPIYIPDIRPEAHVWHPPATQPQLQLISNTNADCLDNPVWENNPQAVPEQVFVLSRAVAEVISGRRHQSTLDSYCLVTVHRRLKQVPQLTGMRVASSRYQVRKDVVEAALRMSDGVHSRALALRFEQRGRRWWITALDY